MASKGRKKKWSGGQGEKELARLHSNSQSPGVEDLPSGEGPAPGVTAEGRTGAWGGVRPPPPPARVGATGGGDET